jgi:signal transduction histidine kinase
MSPEATPQQLLALRDAVLSIAASRSLSDTLARVVAAAARLANARYAALGVPDASGERLIEFITHGLSAEAEARISHRPHGLGLLGLLLREGRSVRVPDLHQHPESAGFPANHPSMTTFLGVPVRQGDQILGNLYLCDKRGRDDPQAVEPFGEEDQAIIELLAAHAAHAVEYARQHEATLARERDLARRNQELNALNAVISATSASLSLPHVLQEALDQVMVLYAVEAADIYLVEPEGGDLMLAVHRSAMPEPFLTHRRLPAGQGLLGQVAMTGEPLLHRNLAEEPRFFRPAVVAAGFRTLLSLPLKRHEQVVGTLNLFARQAEHFDDYNPALLRAICSHIAIAVEHARLHQHVAELAVTGERQRIGMDLHDGVIQALYAAGLTLELSAAQIGDGDLAAAAAGIRGVIERLNTTIHDIRAYLLALRPRRLDARGLAAGLEQLLAEFRANTQMGVSLKADPLAETTLSEQDHSSLFHIAQEVLSNAARHSRATQVAVELRVEGEWVRLSIRDNGRGLPAGGMDDPGRPAGHGLRNIQDRARALAGEAQFISAPGKGTEVRVALPRRAAGGGWRLG